MLILRRYKPIVFFQYTTAIIGRLPDAFTPESLKSDYQLPEDLEERREQSSLKQGRLNTFNPSRKVH